MIKVPSEFLSKKSDTRFPVIIKIYFEDKKLNKNPKK